MIQAVGADHGCNLCQSIALEQGKAQTEEKSGNSFIEGSTAAYRQSDSTAKSIEYLGSYDTLLQPLMQCIPER